MSKRKRNTGDHEEAHERTSKKAKRQELNHVGSEREHRGTNRAQSIQATEEASRARTLGKREKRRLKRQPQAAPHVQDQLKEETEGQAVGLQQKGPRRKHDQQRNGQFYEDLSWKVSASMGGRLLDLDPIFSPDEQHLLLAYESAIAVYSTATSLPVRHLRIKEAGEISAFALSSQNAHELYVSTTPGAIERWDWNQGSRVGYWKLSSSIHSLITSTQTSEEAGNDLVYTVDRKDAGLRLISAHRLINGGDASKSQVKTLLSRPQALSSAKVLEGGRFIIATSGAQLLVGNTNSPNPAVLQDLSYTWRIVDCPEWITSIDVRISHTERERKRSKGGRKTIDSLDIAIGGFKGSIHIYENLLGNLIRREQPTNKEVTEDIKSRRLHWHRNAVLALKWSLDGNYLVSGGEETVLVLWQLETGRKQDLPHLGAPIESIVVSPGGSSYAVRLADNSAMILSTTELRPIFSVAGIQIPQAKRAKSIDLPFMPTVDIPFQGIRPTQRPNAPACTSSSHPGRLLLAVPPSFPSKHISRCSQNKSYLQIFDLGAGHQISRQALTRTKVTSLNMGPESNAIEEPDVILMQTSVDGAWLVTVDEWTPPIRDLAFLAADKERIAEEQNFRKETYLKFWSWNDESKTWELVSRIDEPHRSQSGNPYETSDVLCLVSDPSSVGFATIGADGTVKTWKPTVRRRHGLDVRSRDGRSLTSWHCKHVVPLESVELTTETGHERGRLAYSHDGSILIGALQSSTMSQIYVIDAFNGELRDIQTGLYEGPLLGLGILDKYLITLSDKLLVLDLVNDEIQYGIDLHSCGMSSEKRLGVSHLAVDFKQGLFAIALPEVKHTAKNLTELRSRVAIFDPADAAPSFQTSFQNATTTLLPNSGRKGFIVIDSAAEVITVAPSQSVPSLPAAVSKDDKVAPRVLDSIFGTDRDTKGLENRAINQVGSLKPESGGFINAPSIEESNAVVVSQDRLAEVFDVGPAYALPPVTELFEQVASLYSGQVAS